MLPTFRDFSANVTLPVCSSVMCTTATLFAVWMILPVKLTSAVPPLRTNDSPLMSVIAVLRKLNVPSEALSGIPLPSSVMVMPAVAPLPAPPVTETRLLKLYVPSAFSNRSPGPALARMTPWSVTISVKFNVPVCAPSVSPWTRTAAPVFRSCVMRPVKLTLVASP